MRALRSTLPLLAAPFLSLHAQDSSHTTIGGYGEVSYANLSGPNSPGRANLARFVIYLAHSFNGKFALRSELEVEGARVEVGNPGGEVAVEQVYLDYRASGDLTLRTGLILAPVGILNEMHEPTTYNGVARPAFDTDLLPTTWREIGLGALGSVPGVQGLSYRAYLLNGLRSEGFSAAQGIREGRQEGQDASFANPSLTGRLEWAGPGLRLGGSFWYGGSANQVAAVGTGTFDAAVAVLAADARYENGPFSFRGEAARVSIGGADRINAVFNQGVGSRMDGFYVEGGCNLFQLLAPASPSRLIAFARHERFNTQAAVPTGTIQDLTLARRISTFGLTFKPSSNVVFKADYQLQRNRAAVGQVNALSLGAGYQF